MRTFFVVALAAGLAAPAFAGPDWVERGDAGSFIATAQITTGIGGIRSLTGELTAAGRGAPDLEDVYIIRIDDPSAFSITLVNANFTPALYLFNLTQASQALGLLGVNGTLVSTSTDGTQAQVTEPGLYALAVTYAGNIPQSRTGAIFNFTSPTEISGPDGPGGINPLESWNPTVPLVGGNYDLDVDGVDFADVPAPGAAMLLGAAGLLVARRRR
jgi:hypothetical protein